MQDGQLHIRHLGRQDYESVWHAMQEYTDNRDSESADEIWVVEHPPVFTQGQAGKAEHVLAPWRHSGYSSRSWRASDLSRSGSVSGLPTS